MTLRSKVLLACLLLLGAGAGLTCAIMRASAQLARFEDSVVDLQRDELAADRLAFATTVLRQSARDVVEAPSPARLVSLDRARDNLRRQLSAIEQASRDDDDTQSSDEIARERVLLAELRPLGTRLEQASQAALAGDASRFGSVREAAAELLGWTTRYLAMQDAALAQHVGASGRERRRLNAVAYTVALAAPLIGVFLLVGLMFPLRRGLKRITAAARRLKSGELNVCIPTGADELGEVAGELNAMAAELERMHQSLEVAVLERTGELAESNRQLQLNLARLEDTQSRLKVADRLASLGRLAAGVGHELNNPLAYVLSNLRYVSEELTSPSAREAELRSALDEAIAGAERMRAIVQDLRVMNHGNVDAQEELELLPVLDSAATIALSNARERIALVKELRDAPRVLGNAGRLGQVFLNLLVNAVQAFDGAPERPREIHLRTEIARAGEVRVSIRDTGKGIAPEHLGQIFDPFFTTKPVGVGTGLGLSICHTIVTSLGGDILVDSTPGEGTTVTVLLPEVESARRPAALRKVA